MNTCKVSTSKLPKTSLCWWWSAENSNGMCKSSSKRRIHMRWWAKSSKTAWPANSCSNSIRINLTFKNTRLKHMRLHLSKWHIWTFTRYLRTLSTQTILRMKLRRSRETIKGSTSSSMFVLVSIDTWISVPSSLSQYQRQLQEMLRVRGAKSTRQLRSLVRVRRRKRKSSTVWLHTRSNRNTSPHSFTRMEREERGRRLRKL